ncbi:MAG: hypothetical protein F4X92_07935, partial [Gammaproteobacteria bacterium]|nr:hypothetical protein [Gammaproteobacteria bacterium]
MSRLDTAQRTARDADQVELSALKKSNASIDEGLTDEFISGESEDFIQIEVEDLETEEYARQDQYDDQR